MRHRNSALIFRVLLGGPVTHDAHSTMQLNALTDDAFLLERSCPIRSYRTKQTEPVITMPKIEQSSPVVLVKHAASDAGVTGFSAPDAPLLVTLALAGLFAIGYFIFG